MTSSWEYYVEFTNYTNVKLYSAGREHGAEQQIMLTRPAEQAQTVGDNAESDHAYQPSRADSNSGR